MICKGTTHNSGAKLARYITTGKDGERAQLWQLVGFAAGDIQDAFRSVHVMAEATHCEQPFFHVQVRNPEGEELTRDEWRQVADRIETKLGLTNQPRAVCFHVDEKSDHEHMHVAWSRIDGDSMTARPLPFFKKRLKEVAREMEKKLDLTRVKNDRDDGMRAPSRNEFEQARRLGVDLAEVRSVIRDCWIRSDNGHSFDAALGEQGLILARGDRRAHVVLDSQGGVYALGKRILGISASEVRERLGSINRDGLPTIAEARQCLEERAQGRGRHHVSQPIYDPNRREMEWQDAVAQAAIAKEKIDRAFAEPGPHVEHLGRRAFQELSGVGTLRRKGDIPAPTDLTKAQQAIWTLYNDIAHPREFLTELAQQRMAVARVTKEEADRSHRQSEFARAIGNYSPRYYEGELIVVREAGAIYRRDGQPVEARQIYRLNNRTTGDDRDQIDRFLKPVNSLIFGLDDTRALQAKRAANRADYRDGVREKNARRINATVPKAHSRPIDLVTAHQTVKTVGKALELGEQLIEGLLAPVLTPQQKREGEIAARQRRATAEKRTEDLALKAELAEFKQQQEKEKQLSQASRDRDRDR